ncbi:conserved hypothetical protein (plasmid) [Rhodococcus jostii RHA1]|uniref:TIR domain-containing protein n=1 Tax=Rhodococcus jostii (strain RHA1) TaxID=101510 RepID=Q0RX19_RHOJR|nr:toll/interleukin-1 receptor domain-containing protein [Rhodococcus jostii]ABH00167.1 conserved hypothetical protein [Rhodococcus jostii RHA1]
MGSIFISHSSRDKVFVRRLAMDLVQRDFEIWYDEWNLEVGSRLSNRIKDGVSSSSFVLVVLSREILQSDWVEREINHALEVEEKIQREMLLPIRIDNSNIPDALSDRLYADFSDGSYVQPLETLCEQLRRRIGNHPAGIEPGRELVPLFVEDGVELDAAQLGERIGQLTCRYGSGYEVKPTQFRMQEEEGYRSLRHRMISRLDSIRSDPHYTPEFAVGYRGFCKSILSAEARILKNLATLIAERGSRKEIWIWPETSYRWYWRLARSEIISAMYRMQNPDTPRSDEYGRACFEAVNSEDKMAAIYGVRATTRMAVGDPKSGHEYSFNVDEDSFASRHFRSGSYFGLEMLADMAGSEELVAKWIIPQSLAYGGFEDWDAIDRFEIGLR